MSSINDQNIDMLNQDIEKTAAAAVVLQQNKEYTSIHPQKLEENRELEANKFDKAKNMNKN